MDFSIAVLGGDGIGPEVTAEGVKVLDALGAAFGHRFSLQYGDVGGISIDKHGTPLQDEVRELAGSADAVLFGAVAVPNGTIQPHQRVPRTGCCNSALNWEFSPIFVR